MKESPKGWFFKKMKIIVWGCLIAQMKHLDPLVTTQKKLQLLKMYRCVTTKNGLFEKNCYILGVFLIFFSNGTLQRVEVFCVVILFSPKKVTSPETRFHQKTCLHQKPLSPKNIFSPKNMFYQEICFHQKNGFHRRKNPDWIQGEVFVFPIVQSPHDHWCLRHFGNVANYSVKWLLTKKIGMFTDDRTHWN